MRNHPVGIFIFFFETAASLTYLKWKRKWKDIEDIFVPALPDSSCNSNQLEHEEAKRMSQDSDNSVSIYFMQIRSVQCNVATSWNSNITQDPVTALLIPHLKSGNHKICQVKGGGDCNMCNNTKHMEMYCICIRTSISISYCTVGSLKKHFHLL